MGRKRKGLPPVEAMYAKIASIWMLLILNFVESNFNNHENDETKIRNKLWKWYYEVQSSEIEAFTPVIKRLRKHEDEIINFFRRGHTSAGAERLNGKIQRFVSANYGTRDKDFSRYRIANYFS